MAIALTFVPSKMSRHYYSCGQSAHQTTAFPRHSINVARGRSEKRWSSPSRKEGRMSETSMIEWTDATWNPVRGCTKISPGESRQGEISPGCKHCYAETFAERFRGACGPSLRTGFRPAARAREACRAARAGQSPKTVFVNSMSDLFHESVPDEYIEQVVRVMEYAIRHTLRQQAEPRQMTKHVRHLAGASGIHRFAPV
jgi:protein gp37